MSKLLLGWLVLVVMAFVENGAQAREQWATQRGPRFGFSFTYPAQMFAPVEGERPSCYYYGSEETARTFLWARRKTSRLPLLKNLSDGCSLTRRDTRTSPINQRSVMVCAEWISRRSDLL